MNRPDREIAIGAIYQSPNMRKASSQDSQCPNRRHCLSRSIVSVLTPKLLGFLTAILGTACTLAFASKPQLVIGPTEFDSWIGRTDAQIRGRTERITPQNKLGGVLSCRVFNWHSCQAGEKVNSRTRGQAEGGTRGQGERGTRGQGERGTRGEVGRVPYVIRNAQIKDYVADKRMVGMGGPARSNSSCPPVPQPSCSLLVKKEGTIFPGIGSPVDSTQESKSVPLTPSSLQSQKRQNLDNSRWQADFKPQQPIDLKRSPEQPAHNQLADAVAQVNSLAQFPKEQSAQPIVETPSQPKRSQPTPTQQDVALTLSDVVVLALENNRSLKNAYLERIAQRQDLAVAEDKFVPNVTPNVSISIARVGSNRTTTGADVGVGATVSVTIPTGGELRFRWDTSNPISDFDEFGIAPIDTDDDPFGRNLQLSFRQPLLRGAGINVNMAPIDIARLIEQANILTLKSTLIDTITDAIFAYRELLRAQERLRIEQQALGLAKDILQATQVLIEAGRVAPVDIVQSETAVANREVSLLAAQNNFEARRLALLDILDIAQNLNIVSAEAPTAKPTNLESNNLRQLAFENRPDYLRATLNQKIAQLQLLLAEDDKRWDLSLTTSYNYLEDRTSDVRAGVVLSQELGDLTKEQRFERSRVNLLQANNRFQDLNDSIEIQIKDQIRAVNLLFSQIELAQRATALSQRQLDIEREKQRLGIETGIFELVRLQNELLDARNAELNLTIDYLNALTRLDKTLGTTLATWQIKVERQ